MRLPVSTSLWLRGWQGLEGAIKDYIAAHNQEPRPFVWSKSADDILASIARAAERMSQARQIIQ